MRVVKRSADLTVTLVNDYLEERLLELNRKHLSDHSRWLLVQPSGIFPLVGPIFTPGKSACWNCLADRMARNREVKALLDRSDARCVSASPLARQPLGQSSIQLAAVEIAKAIATDFRTELSDHVVSLDLLGSTIVKHYVAARPQCPACGRKKVRDPRRAPAPVELSGGGKVVMTSGGYRSVSSAGTVARFRKHVSPLTGVVSRLERIQADLPMNTNYLATHNFAAPAGSVNELRAGLNGGSFGKGSTAEQGEASALMEAIERYSGIFQGDEIRVKRRFADFAPGDAILPNDVLLFSDTQYRLQPGADVRSRRNADAGAIRSDGRDRVVAGLVAARRALQISADQPVVFLLPGGPRRRIHADSNGCAAGNTVEEAIVQGFLELVERDSYAIWWYNRLKRAEVDLGEFDDSYIRDLRDQLSRNRTPALGARHHQRSRDSELRRDVAFDENGKDFIEFGSGSHFDRVSPCSGR